MKLHLPCMSLREVSRQLDIPASTITAYRERFSTFIPYVRRGMRRSYPPASLEIFREIRELSQQNLTHRQIERRLAIRYSKLLRRGGGADGIWCRNVPELARALTEVLSKVSELLTEQCQLDDQCGDLQQALRTLRREKEQLEARMQKDVTAKAKAQASLTHRVQGLRQENHTLRALLLRTLSTAGGSQHMPPEQFLVLPLVIQSSGGEFLGVTGQKRESFTLRHLLDLIQAGSEAREAELHSTWRRFEGQWSLSVRMEQEETLVRELEFSFEEMLTPSWNLVACLRDMQLDQSPVPSEHVAEFLRKVRDQFGG